MIRDFSAVLLAVWSVWPTWASAQQAQDPPEVDDQDAFFYDDGLRYRAPEGRFAARFEVRGQFRFSDIDVDADSGVGNQRDKQEFELNRGRLKLGGYAGPEWMKYYTEYDFTTHYLLDLWVEPTPKEWLGFRIGQYKVPYNRERFISSGKQQFAERSTVTPPFTLDRQIGITALGRVFADKAFDSSYWVGVYTGNGRGEKRDDDGQPMLMARWQWNMNRRVLAFSSSDIKRHERPIGSLAIAVSSNRSPYTRYSSSGGGQLPGYEDVADGDFDLRQALGEYAFKYQGVSIQTEYHYKRIRDRVNATENELTGFYFDTGYFFAGLIDWVPAPLELAVRYAQVNTDDVTLTPEKREASLGVNWFFSGHRNKLTLDATRFYEESSTEKGRFWGFRLQWDVSL